MSDTENEPASDLSAAIRSTKPDPMRRPELAQVNSIVLKEGPRSRREVVHYRVHSSNSGEFKANKIGFRTRHKTSGVWQPDHAKSFTLESDDEVRRAVSFIAAACGGSIPDLAGNFVVVPVSHGLDVPAIQAGLNELSASGKTDILAGLLHQIAAERGAAVELFKRVAADPEAFAAAAATITLGRYHDALKQLTSLIEGEHREHDFQVLLSLHPWMFGSEYSEHLADHRHLTRDTQQDFILRRTTDGYIEVLEIKTPLHGVELFRFDKSRKAHYAGPELSAAIGQVSKYIEELEADRHSILARDALDTLKVRARIIIGRDGDDGQRTALRRLNGHLHRIEVITFDQLASIANRTIDHLKRAVAAKKGRAE